MELHWCPTRTPAQSRPPTGEHSTAAEHLGRARTICAAVRQNTDKLLSVRTQNYFFVKTSSGSSLADKPSLLHARLCQITPGHGEPHSRHDSTQPQPMQGGAQHGCHHTLTPGARISRQQQMSARSGDGTEPHTERGTPPRRHLPDTYVGLARDPACRWPGSQTPHCLGHAPHSGSTSALHSKPSGIWPSGTDSQVGAMGRRTAELGRWFTPTGEE